MPLIAIWRDNPEEVRKLSLRQAIALAGTGHLLDGSECSQEFRAFLTEVDPDMLSRYVTECLEPADNGPRKGRRGFEYSGYALQDVINEIGRRLDYDVDSGLYAGRSGAIGFDGIWKDAAGTALVVEVKTTDTYSISLDTIATYRRRLVDDQSIGPESSTLFVVGRDDTGSLEAQIRGSPHAWTMRMIGAASLVTLLQLKVNAEAPKVLDQIRSVLKPVEYTRVDRIIDLLFDVRTEAVIDADEIGVADEMPQSPRPGRSASSPPAAGTEGFRLEVADWISDHAGVRLIKRRRSWFETADGGARAIVAISKRYHRDYQSYWYGVYDTQRAFLREASRAWIALCAADSRRVWLLPSEDFERLAADMNCTVRPDGQTYWHVLTKLTEDSCVIVTQRGEFDLKPFEVA